MYIFLCRHVSNSFGYLFSSGIARSHSYSTFNLFRNYQTLFQSAYTVLRSHQQDMSVPISPHHCWAFSSQLLRSESGVLGYYYMYEHKAIIVCFAALAYCQNSPLKCTEILRNVSYIPKDTYSPTLPSHQGSRLTDSFRGL